MPYKLLCTSFKILCVGRKFTREDKIHIHAQACNDERCHLLTETLFSLHSHQLKNCKQCEQEP